MMSAPVTYPNRDRARWPAEDIACCRGSGKGLGDFEPVEEVGPRCYSGPVLVGCGTVFSFNVLAMRVAGQMFAEAVMKDFRERSLFAKLLRDGQATP